MVDSSEKRTFNVSCRVWNSITRAADSLGVHPDDLIEVMGRTGYIDQFVKNSAYTGRIAIQREGNDLNPDGVETISIAEFNDCIGNSVTYEQDANLDSLPDIPGLYFICKAGLIIDFSDVLYVGVSEVSIRQRWKSHHKHPALKFLSRVGFKWVILCWVPIPGTFSSGDLTKLESRLINAINPTLNNFQPFQLSQKELA